MHMRRALLLLATLTCACSANPAAPTDHTAAPSGDLAPGRYSLSLSNSAQPGLSLCMSIGANPPVTAISLTADAVSDGAGGLVVRTENPSEPGLTLKLRPSGGSVEGTLEGTATDVVTERTVTVDGGSDATSSNVSGSVRSSTSVAGFVNGRVMFVSRDGATRSCSENAWSLNRLQ